jgi:hypothetical protein
MPSTSDFIAPPRDEFSFEVDERAWYVALVETADMDMIVLRELRMAPAASLRRAPCSIYRHAQEKLVAAGPGFTRLYMHYTSSIYRVPVTRRR